MEFKEFSKAMKRMCRSLDCKDCHMETLTKHNTLASCYTIAMNNPEEADEIVSKWASEHPLKTNAERIKEVFGLDISVDLSDNGDSTVRINGSSFRGNEKLKDWLEDRYVEM